MSKTIRNKAVSLLIIFAMVVTTLAVSTTPAEAKASKYWIKINRKANVVTVYKRKNGKWKPIRAMLCCTGKKSTPTPLGTFRLSTKFRWIHMITDGWHSYEQYTTRFYGEYYIHSCCYKSPRKNKEYTRQFKALGKRRTHGCIRMSVMDAKWIYDKCKKGTKVTVYSSKKPGPLGRPKNIKLKRKKKYGWDPTDPSRNNPSFKMYAPEFTIKKKTKIDVGTKYDLKAGVKVLNPNALQDITYGLKVKRLYRDGKRVLVSSFSTKKPGKYTVVYYVRDKYMVKKGMKGTTKKFTFQVVDFEKEKEKERKKKEAEKKKQEEQKKQQEQEQQQQHNEQNTENPQQTEASAEDAA